MDSLSIKFGIGFRAEGPITASRSRMALCLIVFGPPLALEEVIALGSATSKSFLQVRRGHSGVRGHRVETARARGERTHAI